MGLQEQLHAAKTELARQRRAVVQSNYPPAA